MNGTAQTHYDVIILGAGAAGLFCAFTAANRGLQVLLLDKANKIGKKILMSGGGRCNFTNYVVEADNYISNNPHFCKSALKQFTQWDFIALVDKYNIDYEERKHGQLFCKNSASDILTMLQRECELAGVTIKTHCDVQSVDNIAINNTGEQKNNSRYQLNVNQKGQTSNLYCDSLVVATGALSIPTLGGSDFGYKLAEQFNLPLIERRAGLVPFMFSDTLKPICERLSGLALEVVISCRGQSFTENLLFTHRGISGPSVLQISNYWYPGDEIIINLLPHIDAAGWLVNAKQQQGKSLLKTVLSKHLSKSLVRELQSLWWARFEQTPLAEFSDQHLTDIGQQLNNWRLKPSATEGYRTAEVTLGGVDTDVVSSKTMEVKQQPGLYFIGEVLDVSGHLGGFNFQWAWSSGYVAGMSV